jgi:uncharacterized protein YoxC
MKLGFASLRRPIALSGLLLTMLAVLPQPGCRKGDEEPTEVVKLPPALVSLQDEVGKGKAQIGVTIGALEAVVAAAGPGAKPKFDEFVKAMAALEAQSTAIKAKADDMRARGAAYFKAWEDQLATVATPSIKEAAEKRRDQLTKHYEGVTAAAEAAREAYKPLLSDLRDVQKMLTTDLTADSVKALAAPVAKLKDTGKALGDKLDAVVEALKKIGAVYSAQS